jgi:hypothetical protein
MRLESLLPCAEAHALPLIAMRVRARILLWLVAAAAVAVAMALLLAGIGGDALIAAPALVLLVPLAAGRYVGSERLARLVRRLPAPRRRGAEPRPAPRRPLRRAGARGGLLIAVALGRRGPPESALAR